MGAPEPGEPLPFRIYRGSDETLEDRRAEETQAAHLDLAVVGISDPCDFGFEILHKHAESVLFRSFPASVGKTTTCFPSFVVATGFPPDEILSGTAECILQSWPFGERMTALASFPPFHSISSSNPPRARIPLT